MNQDQRIADMIFSTVYPLYLAKVQRKGRSEAELLEVIKWLTGFEENELNQLLETKVSFKMFFEQAQLNPAAELITGTICGYRIELIENPLTRKVRCLDKLVDELAKGRSLDKIRRKNKPANNPA